MSVTVDEFWQGVLWAIGALASVACLVIVVVGYLAITMDIGPFWFVDTIKGWFRRGRS